jgi:hypothetical protein
VDEWDRPPDPDDSVPADRLAGLLGRPTGPVNWLELSADRAAQQWAQLRAWVCWLRTTFAYDHRVVPPCWYLHGAFVDLLTALRDHHEYAFSELQPGTAASEWHRAFRELEPRLRDWASRTGCTRDQHRPDVTVEWPDDTARWKAHVVYDEQQRLAAEQAEPRS